MDKLNSPGYEDIFMQPASQGLTQAVEHVLQKKKAKTLGDIAKKTHVSNSTLTSYMNGDKKISEHFKLKFNLAYNLDISNPLSYLEEKWLEDLLSAELPPISPEVYIRTFNTFRKIIMAQQMTIEGMRRTNAGLRKMNREMFDTLLRNQEILVTETLRNKTFL